jgi:hypothetical protein
MKTMLIIKGAVYTDGDLLLRPHYTGDFYCVDCTEYKTKSQIKEEYSGLALKEMLSNDYLTYEGEKYFRCEYSPYNTEGLLLLSDLSNLGYFDDSTEF